MLFSTHLAALITAALVPLPAATLAQSELDAISPPPTVPTEGLGARLAFSGGALALAESESISQPPGRTLLYRRSGHAWNETQVLTFSSNNRFTRDLAISGDWLAIARPRLGFSAQTDEVQLYHHDASGWSLAQTLVGGLGSATFSFGASIAMQGNTLFVGSIREGVAASGELSGQVHVFEETGGSWIETQVIVGPGGGVNQFGSTVETFGDLAAIRGRIDQGGFRPHVSILERSTSGWNVAASFEDPDPSGGTGFGDMALGEDVLAVGQWLWDAPATDAGRVLLYEKISGSWTPTDVLQGPDPETFDHFGMGLAFAGEELIVGVPGNDPPGVATGFSPGTLERFRRDPLGVWSHAGSVSASLGSPTDGLGATVQAAGATVAASAMRRRLTSTSEGGASVFEFGDAEGLVLCDASPNSTGDPAALYVRGDLDVSANALRLDATGLPPATISLGIVSPTRGFLPGVGGSQGTLCVGVPTGRMLQAVAFSNSFGRVAIPIDLTAVPQPNGAVVAAAGDTWVFQLWFRDANPSSTSNFTNSVEVTLQ